MSPTDEPFRLVTEVDFEARCILHGGTVSFQPRPLNLGHGRMVIDLGRAQCHKCGSSRWLTIQVADTRWENVSAHDVRTNMERVLTEEFAQSLAAATDDVPVDEEPEEEVQHQRSPSTGAQSGSAAPIQSPLGPRRRL